MDIKNKKGFICDMDGVLYHGNKLLPGAIEFINWLKKNNKQYLFLTNNSGYTPKELHQKLKRLGADVSEEHFYTSALATAEFLKSQKKNASAYVIGDPGLLNALYDAGITMNDVNPDYVVIGEGKNYSLDSITKAVNLVLNGANLIGANSDLTGNIENGLCPACKALIAPIEMATGKKAYFCGKPNPLMMRTGIKLLSCHSEEAVIIGDRMDTDIVSGLESGIDTILVLSGVSSSETVKEYAFQPTMIFKGIGDIIAEPQ
jgi:NagD protein